MSENESLLYSDNLLSSLAPITDGNRDIISFALRDSINTVVGLWICLILATFGVVTNTLTLAVFHKQGYKDITTISLVTITFWDFLRCICGTFHRLYGIVQFCNPALAKSWYAITTTNLLLIQIIHSGYASNFLAAFLAIHRCLCIALPLHVKLLMTPKVTLTICIVISVVVCGVAVVFFLPHKIIWEFDPRYNTTLAVGGYTDFYLNNQVIITDYYNTINLICPFSSFIIICCCTVLMMYYLKKSSDFKHKLSAAPGHRLSNKDKKVVRMLLVIIAVYLTNFIPRLALYIARFFEYDLFSKRRYDNLNSVCLDITYVFDFINSSTNIFIFLTMNTNFRLTFYNMFLPKNARISLPRPSESETRSKNQPQ